MIINNYKSTYYLYKKIFSVGLIIFIILQR